MKLVAIALAAILGSGAANAVVERPYVVVIDPGHGGRDPGAVRPNGGGTEKSITLAISLAVRDQLRETRNVKVILTRSSDRYVTLVGRRDIAEVHHADLFLSIHADSIQNALTRGASVYTLREDGRTVVADRIASAIGPNRIAMRTLDPNVAFVLGDLQERAAMNDSADFAARLSKALSSVVSMRNQPRLSAHFAVLKARGIPAILLETGYLTANSDAKVLFSILGQRRIAKAIVKAIDNNRGNDHRSQIVTSRL